MCGICGALGRADGPVLRRMTQSLTHRGPDDEGFHLADGIALGVRRLSIIDVPGGRQPVTNEDGSLVVIFNGEIWTVATRVCLHHGHYGRAAAPSTRRAQRSEWAAIVESSHGGQAHDRPQDEAWVTSWHAR